MPRLFLASVLLSGVLSAVPADPSTAVYVGPVVSPSGFTEVDPGVRDSIRDVQSQVRRQHDWRLVDMPSDADLVLRVVRRAAVGP